MIPGTLQFIIAMIASAINERMQRKLDYVQEEVRVLREVVLATTGSTRISFTAGQRRRLALAGKELSPRGRRKYCQLVTPQPSWPGFEAWARESTIVPIVCRSRLGTLLNYYHREAA
jgi:hypothetical protein